MRRLSALLVGVALATASAAYAQVERGEFAIDALPASGTIDIGKLTPGDYVICAQVTVDAKPLATYSFGLSIASEWKRRLEAARKALTAESPPSGNQFGDDSGSAR